MKGVSVILVMPTMREWLRIISSDTLKYEKTKEFTESEYYRAWSGLLSNKYLHKLLDDYDIDLLFYPHPTMQQYIDHFKTDSKRIIIASAKRYDMQQLLMESACLITDYSSIYFDFAYMLKPMVYYHFDYEKYRKGQYQEGYFSYKNDGFGPIAASESELLKEIEKILKNNLRMEEKYKDRTTGFFAYRDTNNCCRTFEVIRLSASTNR